MSQELRRGTVLVTGSNGFIGSAVLQAFHARGWNVVAATRGHSRAANATSRFYDLSADRVPADLLDGVDVVVHAACARGPGSRAINTRGTTLLFEVAAQRAVYFLFISSMAAHEGALSDYGRHKFEIEAFLYGRAGIVRPGLVLGHGGLFGRIRNFVLRYRVIPMIDGGRQPLQTIYIDDLSAIIQDLVDNRSRGLVLAAETPPTTYKAFFEAFRAALGMHVALMNVPSWALFSALRVARRLAIRLPIDEDNVLGLLAMRSMAAFEDTPTKVRIRNYVESLHALMPR